MWCNRMKLEIQKFLRRSFKMQNVAAGNVFISYNYLLHCFWTFRFFYMRYQKVFVFVRVNSSHIINKLSKAGHALAVWGRPLLQEVLRWDSKRSSSSWHQTAASLTPSALVCFESVARARFRLLCCCPVTSLMCVYTSACVRGWGGRKLCAKYETFEKKKTLEEQWQNAIYVKKNIYI